MRLMGLSSSAWFKHAPVATQCRGSSRWDVIGPRFYEREGLIAEAKMLDLARIQAALADLVRVCRGKGPTSVCPILDALDEQEAAHGDR